MLLFYIRNCSKSIRLHFKLGIGHSLGITVKRDNVFDALGIKAENLSFCMLIYVLAIAHMRMSLPLTRGETYDLAPISSEQFPCKGLPAMQPTPIKAGSTIASHIKGSANHGTGFCQWSLSYDSIKFIVIHTIPSGCPTPEADYSIPIPSNIPNGDAILLWSWMNEIGNREFYTNCADVTVTGSTGNTFKGNALLVGNIQHNGQLLSFPENQVSKLATAYVQQHAAELVSFSTITSTNTSTITSNTTNTNTTNTTYGITNATNAHIFYKRRVVE